MVDKTFWAIKNVKTGNLVGDKWNRTLWVIKPTNAMESIKWKAKTFYNKDLDLKPIRVRVVEVES